MEGVDNPHASANEFSSAKAGADPERGHVESEWVQLTLGSSSKCKSSPSARRPREQLWTLTVAASFSRQMRDVDCAANRSLCRKSTIFTVRLKLIGCLRLGFRRRQPKERVVLIDCDDS